jgi:hypothetical protein
LIDSEDAAYPRVVSDYIHLNPARAGLVNPEAPRLVDYRWSSLPAIVQGDASQWWLNLGVAMQWHRWESHKQVDRLAYGDYMQARAQECWEPAAEVPLEGKAKKEDQRSVVEKPGRGWALGSAYFADQMKALAEKATRGKKRESYSGEGAQRHDQQRAQEMLERGMEVLGINEEALVRMKKNDERKQTLAWMVKTHTAVRDEWICSALKMGHRSNVSRAVKTISQKPKRNESWKQILHICTD